MWTMAPCAFTPDDRRVDHRETGAHTDIAVAVPADLGLPSSQQTGLGGAVRVVADHTVAGGGFMKYIGTE